MAWPIGTDPQDELKKRLAVFIDECFKGAYKSRLPRGFRHVLDGNADPGRKTGVFVRLYTGADEAPPRAIPDTSGNFQENALKLTMDVEADNKNGGGEAVESVFAVLQSIITNPATVQALIDRGIYNVRQNGEALQIDDREWKRPLTFTCTVDVLI